MVYHRDLAETKHEMLEKIRDYFKAQERDVFFIDDSLDNCIETMNICTPGLALWGYIIPGSEGHAGSMRIKTLSSPADVPDWIG